MEYVMSYGWAIIVVMAIGGGMYYLGLFDPMVLMAGLKNILTSFL